MKIKNENHKVLNLKDFVGISAEIFVGNVTI